VKPESRPYLPSKKISIAIAVTYEPEAFDDQGNYVNAADTLFRRISTELAPTTPHPYRPSDRHAGEWVTVAPTVLFIVNDPVAPPAMLGDVFSELDTTPTRSPSCERPSPRPGVRRAVPTH